jgi:GDP-L-fucose synthase
MKKILLLGASGLLGSSVKSNLSNSGYTNVISPARSDLNLCNRLEVEAYFKKNTPDIVINCAAKAGGIQGNIDDPVSFIQDNLDIQNNTIIAASKTGCKKYIFISSTCIYPSESKQPMKEEYILTNKFTKGFEPYCIAKVCGNEMLLAYKKMNKLNSNTILLPNLYGPNDHYGDDSNHVIPALIERFINAKRNNLKQVEVWGSGNSIREFLYTEDAADGIIFLMENYDDPIPINLSSSVNISIKDLAITIKKITGYEGNIFFNTNKPEGAKVKISDNKKILSLGWQSSTSLENGLKKTVEDFLTRF